MKTESIFALKRCTTYLQNTHKLIHQTNVIYAQMSDDIYDDGAQNTLLFRWIQLLHTYTHSI